MVCHENTPCTKSPIFVIAGLLNQFKRTVQMWWMLWGSDRGYRGDGPGIVCRRVVANRSAASTWADQWGVSCEETLARRGWCDGDNRILIESSVMRQPRPGLWSHTACYWTQQSSVKQLSLSNVNISKLLCQVLHHGMGCDVVLLTGWQMYWLFHETMSRWELLTLVSGHQEGWEVMPGWGQGGGGNQLHPIIGGWAVSGVRLLPSR